MRHVTGTLIAYYFYCKRRMWLHANEIRFEDNSEDVAMGKLIEETTYQERNDNYEQIELEGIKIDFYDPKNRIIHETKKSPKFEETHVWQLKYYIYVFLKNGIEDVKGILEYPTERRRKMIELNEKDKAVIENLSKEILMTISSEECPGLLSSLKCKNCSYYEFCYANEEEY
jgi:CRISPR-associated exonuclease Cas4